VEAQGGDRSYIENPCKFTVAKYTRQIYSKSSGYIGSIDTEGLGIAAMILGAGRKTPEDEICYSSGIVLQFEQGSYVEKGQVLADIYTNNSDALDVAEDKVHVSIEFSPEKPQIVPLIYEKIGF